MDHYLNKKVEIREKIFGVASSTYFIVQENMNRTVGVITNIYDNKFIELDNKDYFIDGNLFRKSHVGVYKLTDKELPLPVDTIGKPFFFKIDANLYSSDIFIPNKNIPQLTTAYINRTLNNPLIK